MSTRRGFLTRLGVGLLGSSALLLQPGRILASFRGRNRGNSLPPCPVPCEVPILAPAIIQRKNRVQTGADVTLFYPPSGGLSPIPGGGDFACWGCTGSGSITVESVHLTDKNGNDLNVNHGTADLSDLIGQDWGFTLFDIPAGTTFYLTIYYQKPKAPGVPPQPTYTTTGSFTV